MPFPQVDGDNDNKTQRTHTQGVADIDDEEKRVRESEGKEVCKVLIGDISLVANISSMKSATENNIDF